MRNHHQYPAEENGVLFPNGTSCNCCPYGYHIDLDFVRYCESLANAKPSNGQLLRRDKRLSRKSLEVMLGLEDFYQWEPADKVRPLQEVQYEVEPDSPRVVNRSENYSCHLFGDSPTCASSNSSPEACAFVRDALDEVVSDFERTLERTKKKDRHQHIWNQYFDVFDSCVSGSKSQTKHDVTPTPEKEEEVESVESNGSELSTNALHTIRQQMALSLKRMRDLEEEVKNIPILQKQLSTLKEEKHRLEMQLKREESLKISTLSTNIMNTTTNKLTAIAFTPQRISPVSLESLGSRLRSESPSDIVKKTIKRDVGVGCVQQTRDIGTSAGSVMVRSIGTNPVNTLGVNEDLYTKHEVDDLIPLSIKEYEEKKESERQQNRVSVGTQSIGKQELPSATKFVQTDAEKIVYKTSQGVMARPAVRDVSLSHKPETRTIGISDHNIVDFLCDKCCVSKRNVSCGTDIDPTKTYLSLKSMDLPPRSLSFSLGENEKLNIRRKTVGTQSERCGIQHVGIQNVALTCSAGTQNSPLLVTKSTQSIVENNSVQTDTKNLIKCLDFACNTDTVPKILAEKCDNYTSTETIRTKDHQTNTNPPPKTLNTSSNTEIVYKKDIACGSMIRPPHISISCSDNYCDSCKDVIKNLAREFTKVTLLPTLSGTNGNGNGDVSRIPRPTTLTSPRPERKKFVRQNTYTISTPSPSAENRAISETSSSETQSNSLDSVQTIREKTTSKNIEHVQILAKEISSTNEEIIYSIEQKLPDDRELSPPKLWDHTVPVQVETIVNGNDATEEVSPHEDKILLKESSSQQEIQDMLLSQIATAAAVPRKKATPSKEMKAAMKVINDSLQKSNPKQNNLKNANLIVQEEWFKISSTDHANPLDVEDYLDCFEEFSNNLIRYIVNRKDANGNSAMHYAVSHGNFDVVSILLDSKVCDVNQTNNAGYTCVMLVSLAKLKNSAHRTVVQRLFQMADVNVRAKKHCQTALMLAVSHGNLDMVEMLLVAGADINIQDEDGSTALMCAAEHGRIDIVKHLLAQQDCDSLIQDVDGSTAFKIAWQAGHRDIGLLLYVHEQMLRNKLPGRQEQQRTQTTPRHQKHH